MFAFGGRLCFSRRLCKKKSLPSGRSACLDTTGFNEIYATFYGRLMNNL